MGISDRDRGIDRTHVAILAPNAALEAVAAARASSMGIVPSG
jgi:hypothetical protein